MGLELQRTLEMRALRAIALFVSLLGLAWFVAVARYDWDDWAAAAVQTIHEPLEINLVNGTPANIPVMDIGISGFFCQARCVTPGRKVTCRPQFGEASPVYLQIGLTAEEAFPKIIHSPLEPTLATVTWRSYGVIDLELTDAGVAVRRFPDQFEAF